jgi:hypothetical protein
MLGPEKRRVLYLTVPHFEGRFQELTQLIEETKVLSSGKHSSLFYWVSVTKKKFNKLLPELKNLTSNLVNLSLDLYSLYKSGINVLKFFSSSMTLRPAVS